MKIIESEKQKSTNIETIKVVVLEDTMITEDTVNRDSTDEEKVTELNNVLINQVKHYLSKNKAYLDIMSYYYSKGLFKLEEFFYKQQLESFKNAFCLNKSLLDNHIKVSYKDSTININIKNSIESHKEPFILFNKLEEESYNNLLELYKIACKDKNTSLKLVLMDLLQKASEKKKLSEKLLKMIDCGSDWLIIQNNVSSL